MVNEAEVLFENLQYARYYKVSVNFYYQVLTGSSDHMVKLWDIRTGKNAVTLTMHKKSVRAMVKHPRETSFASASPDNIKKFQLPEG